MTETEFEIYLGKALDAPLGQGAVRWYVRDFWNQLFTRVYERYGKRLNVPTNICESINPFTIHFTWDDNTGSVLGCSVKGSEIYVSFNHSYFYKDESNTFQLKIDSWKEFLYLPKIQISERLMEVFYLYYLEKNNDH